MSAWQDRYLEWVSGTESLEGYSAENQRKLHDLCMGSIPPSWSIRYLEFGVCGGTTLRWWVNGHKHPESMFFGFDSFHGLPEPWEEEEGQFLPAGALTVHGRIPPIADPRLEFYAGWFADTLPQFFAQWSYSGMIVAHIDCDLLSSSRTVFTHLAPHLKPGDLVIMDEAGSVQAEEYQAYVESGVKGVPRWVAGCAVAVEVL